MPSQQAKYWMLTIPHADFTPFLPATVEYIRGQLERGNQTDYLHWQIIISMAKKTTFNNIKNLFGSTAHIEMTRSDAADKYCFKDDTRIANTQFELGKKSLKRNSSKDWDLVRDLAIQGKFSEIPSDILIRNYSSLKKIHVDNVIPMAQEKEVYVFWGRTGTGKSKRAWEEATMLAYPKSPTSIWWCGYQGHENVVIDEFRGIKLRLTRTRTN